MVLVVENLPAGGHGTLSSILAWRIPWTERSLVGYGPQGRKESDMK